MIYYIINIMKKQILNLILSFFLIKKIIAFTPNKSLITPLERMIYLDLIWKIREEIDTCDVSKDEICGEVCKVCQGDGILPCRFCGGTGFLMLGHDLIGTNNDCIVCKGTGDEECKLCMGAGYIVEWRKDYK